MNKDKLIIIPILEDAIDRLNYDCCIDGDLIEISLSFNEYKNLESLGLFEAINECLGIGLGEYEDELIFNDKFIKLEIMLLNFIKKYPTNKSLYKFFICKIAFKLNTAILISF
ncbi:hypothetical protein [Moraxella bovis]|uniref:hypothetical protein n=1 Tax=Moraxella bovis TaxID=476 RepID=UPI002227D808|nr:hypothetical protein [Moraxella bovis]UZA36804.1 hypothetical protein LP098_14345 [Moraxella bovis]